MHPCVQNKQIIPQENLGVLLLEFLELFGRHFNFEEVGLGVSLKKGAFYFRKVIIKIIMNNIYIYNQLFTKYLLQSYLLRHINFY